MSVRPRGTFRQTRRALSRVPTEHKVWAAALCGGFLVYILQELRQAYTSEAGQPVMMPVPERSGSSVHSASARNDWLIDSRPRPRPLVVIVAGLPRTGSTWVYNIARILMRIRDPNSIAGWYADLIAIWKNHKTHRYDNMKISWLDAYKSLNTSLVIKTHGPGAFKAFSRGKSLGEGADVTLLTHRDLRTEVRSWVYQNWNNSIHAGNIAHTPFADAAAWTRVAAHILRERNMTMESVGKGRYLDIRYEDWNRKGMQAQLQIVQKIAAELEWDFTARELRQAVIEASRIHPPAYDTVLMYNPVSKLHPGHERVDASDLKFQKALKAGYKAIEKDVDGGAFLRQQGYH